MNPAHGVLYGLIPSSFGAVDPVSWLALGFSDERLTIIRQAKASFERLI